MEKELIIKTDKKENLNREIIFYGNNLSILIKLNNNLIDNIDRVFKLLIKKENVDKLIIDISNLNSFDEERHNKFLLFLVKYFTFISELKKIEFRPFSHDEIVGVLSYVDYLKYCNLNGLEPKWDKRILSQEQEKIKDYKKNLVNETISYEFNTFVDFIENLPYTFLIYFGGERDEFIFKSPIFSEDRINSILSLFDFLSLPNLDVFKKYLKFGKDIRILETGLGINRSKSRFILYFWFRDTFNEEMNLSFIKKIFSIDSKNDSRAVNSIQILHDSISQELLIGVSKRRCDLSWLDLEKDLFNSVDSMKREFYDYESKKLLYEEYLIDSNQNFSKEELDILDKEFYFDRETNYYKLRF